ncbi:MAG: hypothetical protein K9M51_03830 [Candidatus Gracilibacteria bacterium]|nr:hypothetical protein [Candidatus Gracilibacteria bacterium]
MNIFNSIRNAFRPRKGSGTVTYVPAKRLADIEKKYINTLDEINNRSEDFKQTVFKFLSLPEVRQEFKEMYLGNIHDAYQTHSYKISAINSLELLIEDAISSEKKIRLDIVSTSNQLEELTTLDLTENQRRILLEFEEQFKETALAKIKSESIDTLKSGLNAEKSLLDADKQLHELRKQDLIQKRELSDLKSKKFQESVIHQVKEYYQKKSDEHPTLTKSYMKDCQKDVSAIMNFRNGNGLNHPGAKSMLSRMKSFLSAGNNNSSEQETKNE